MRIVYKIIIFSVVCYLLYLIVSNFSLLTYAYRQAKGELHILMNTRNVDDVLLDPEFPDSLKKKLKIIQEVRWYAFDSIGLNQNHNYTTVYDQKGMPLMWVVTASKPFEIEAYEWKFPILGSLSYKGFFERSEAEKEAAFFRKSGYDTDIGTAGGWSTLGFFKDPILSGMLNRDEGQLANLIIHELTHGTVYVGGDVPFNENLANFIGNEGAKNFLKQKYGAHAAELERYLNSRESEKKFNQYTLDFTRKFNRMYKGMLSDMDYKKKLFLKDSMIHAYIHGVDSLGLMRANKYRKFAEESLQSKNAFFISFLQYESAQDTLDSIFRTKYHSDLKVFIRAMAKKYPGSHFF